MDDLWRLTPHACRVCLGRVLARVNQDGTQSGHVRCAECGLEADGGHKSLCACGQRNRGGRDAGLRCAVNENRCLEMPQEIIVVSVPQSRRRQEGA
jgi:hypothetical protein